MGVRTEKAQTVQQPRNKLICGTTNPSVPFSRTQDLGVKVGELQTLFSRVSCELDSKACASEIEKALHDMASKIHESADQQGRLQRLGKTLAKDSKTLAAIKRLQIDLEQVFVAVREVDG